MYPNPTNTTILIVDHDAVNLRLARRVLESAGFEVCEATDAVSTFEVLKTCRPAMIVLDIQLPGMDGWELTHRLKTNFATKDIPIIVVTAFGTRGRPRLRDCGRLPRVRREADQLDRSAQIIRRHLADLT